MDIWLWLGDCDFVGVFIWVFVLFGLEEGEVSVIVFWFV